MLIAIEFIGKNGPVAKQKLFDHLVNFTNPDKDAQVKSRGGATNDVLYYIREILRFVEGDDTALVLTSSVHTTGINLYSGKDLYAVKLRGDLQMAYTMLQTNNLHFSPEIRDMLAFISKKRRARRADVGTEYLKKRVYGHTFNQATIDFALKTLLLLGLIELKDNYYSIKYIHPLMFAQILLEEYQEHENPVDGTVSSDEMRDLFDLKYEMGYDDFDKSFSAVRLLMPQLIVTGSYGKYSMDMDVARRLNLYA
ncbi:MAG: Uncharacterized protein XE11_1476 [Methanomicrobiales archaeon 53_19]|jgi:hypothetical protein|nr:MAG: Uncharacterized protein XD88_0393 [Methanocalculus sp. 52_23]KUL03063.1 MAG: Uncharacterized protein XE11_1476 [Methanomicrobiales archaeon 53_19]